MSSQIAMPTEVNEIDISRERSLGGAIELCAKAAGYAFDKELSIPLGVDKGQLSRWQSGAEGVKWEKLRALMDFCGNHAPVLWMLHQLGYDIGTLRKRETELQRELRLEREKNEQLQVRLAHLEDFVRLAK